MFFGRRSLKFFGALGLTTVVLSSLSIASATENGVSNERILVGLSTDLSSLTASNAAKSRLGAALYIDQINSQGGVHGRQIKVIHYDDGYEPKVAIENLKKLIVQDKVFCLFQNYGSESALAVMPLVEQYDVPFIAPIASTEQIRVPMRKNVFTVRTSSAHETDGMLRFVTKTLGLREIAIVNQQDAFGSNLRDNALTALRTLGLTPVFTDQFARNSTDVDGVINGLVRSKAKAVVIAAQILPSRELIKKASARGYRPVYLGGIAQANEQFLQAFGKEPPKFYFSSSFPIVHKQSEVPLIKEFLKEAKRVSLEPDALTLEGYVNAKVFIEGLKRAGKDLTRDSLRKALESMSGVDFGGITVYYSKQSHRGMSEVFLGTLKDGQFVPVER